MLGVTPGSSFSITSGCGFLLCSFLISFLLSFLLLLSPLHPLSNGVPPRVRLRVIRYN